MNFLAHAVLAGSLPDRIAGSMAGDFVKGVLYDGDYPDVFLVGLRLHRRIDAFSNSEVHLRQSAARLPRELRRIAPPCIDMLADHFLASAAAANPRQYLTEVRGHPESAADLKSYENTLHLVLLPHVQRLSCNARRFFDHAQRSNLLSDYKSFDRTARGINHVCGRLGSPGQGPAVVDACAAHIDELREDFENYWPALTAEANRYLAS